MAMMNQRGQMVPPGGGLQPGMMPNAAAGPGMMGPRPGMQYIGGGPSPGGGGGMMPQVNLYREGHYIVSKVSLKIFF